MDPPIIAYHIVFGAYGFWLPNDPRGSWSKQVWAPNLVRFGPPKPANTNRSLAKQPHDRQLRLAAKAALARPAVRFNEVQIQCVAQGIQTLRSNMEQDLNISVGQANAAMNQIAQLNTQLQSMTTNDPAAANLMDQRDSAIDQLSQLMDIRVSTNGSNQATIYTSNGVEFKLLTRASRAQRFHGWSGQ